MAVRKNVDVTGDANLDPISGEPGAHPIETGAGAALGGLAAGAAAGMVAGPVGAVVGAAVGAIAGGLGGKAVGESIDPTTENAYWKENHRAQSYADPATPYETYQPAYQYGWEARNRHTGKRFDDVEPTLRSEWEKTKSNAQLQWEKAKHATRAAWDRADRYTTST